MKVKLEPGAYPPERAHNTDAGYDLRAVEGVYIDAGGAAVIDTGCMSCSHPVLPDCWSVNLGLMSRTA